MWPQGRRSFGNSSDNPIKQYFMKNSCKKQTVGHSCCFAFKMNKAALISVFPLNTACSIMQIPRVKCHNRLHGKLRVTGLNNSNNHQKGTRAFAWSSSRMAAETAPVGQHVNISCHCRDHVFLWGWFVECEIRANSRSPTACPSQSVICTAPPKISAKDCRRKTEA